MKNTLSKIKKLYTPKNIFIIGLIYLLIQHFFVGMYFDDYGNVSLSYGHTIKVSGTDWSFSQLFEWISWCYMNYSGRVLPAFIIDVLMKHGPLPFMLLQALILWGIIYCLYKIICLINEKINKNKVSILLWILYGVIDITVHNNGTYWGSASVCYVWPMLPVFVGVYYYLLIVKDMDNKKPVRYYVLLFVTVAIASFSQEQISVFLFTLYLFIIIIDLLDKKYSNIKFTIFVLLWSLIFTGFCLLAPGNTVRMSEQSKYGGNLLQRMIASFPNVIDVFFIRGIFVLNITLTLSIILVSYLHTKKDGLNKLIVLPPIIIIPLLFFATVETVLKHSNPVILIIKEICEIYILLIWIIYIVSYFRRVQQKEMIAVLFAGGASFLCLVAAPYATERSLIPFIFCEIMIITVIVGNTPYSSIANEKVRKFTYFSTKFISVFALCNVVLILTGYISNYPALVKNDKTLRNYQSGETIELSRLPNRFCRSSMPYDNGFDFIEYWMREYYDIPQDVVLKWEKY